MKNEKKLSTRFLNEPDADTLPAINSPWYQLVFRVISMMLKTTHQFYLKKGIDPIIMPVTCGSISSPMGLGSDSVPVKIELFGRDVYLADSMQFQLEYLLRNSNKGVYYVMPTFRGEDHSKRHLNQFFHSELEMYGGLDEVMDMAEAYVKYLAVHLLQELGSELFEYGIDTVHIDAVANASMQIPRIRFDDVKDIIGDNEEYFDLRVIDAVENVYTLSHAGERTLMDSTGGVCWVTHYPKKVVPFYQARHEDSANALCADLLMGVGEVLGCGQRNRTLKETLDSLSEHQVETSEYQWYLALKKHSPITTSGFGLGIERYILWLLNHDDIRDIPLFNRLKGEEVMP